VSPAARIRASEEDVTIVLSPSQVQHVLRCAGPAAGAPDAAHLLAALPPAAALARRTSDPQLSRSLLRGLAILARMRADGRRERGIVELAAELGMSGSTAHRYAQTLVELGLLERCPRTRKYRLAPH
jgi:hypothetical protein